MSDAFISSLNKRTIRLKGEDVSKLSVVSLIDAKTSMDSKTNELTFEANQVGPKMSWRLVHDGKRVVTLFESDGYTVSAYTIFESEKEEECLKEIKRLGLEYSPDEELNGYDI